MKGDLDIDPRGLIYESYRIDGIVLQQCRSIFLDWALGVALDADMTAHITTLMTHYGKDHPDHPMTQVLHEGLARPAVSKGRRGGRRARVSQS